ncbi:MAG TPA: FtsX-like permease family protein [Geobacteraceae bacterium]|nr:FtsX-like permease family protein [Geobacteraceae bacterium]
MLQSIERQRHLIDFTLSSLMRRKGKNFSVLFVYTLVVFLLASVMFFTSALRKEAHLVLTNAPEIIVQRSLSGRFSFIPVDYGKKLADIRGVVSVRERLWGYYYDPEFKANYTFMVPEKLPVEQGTIAIGAGISNTRHAYEGDILSFTSPDGVLRSYTVKSVLSEESQLVAADIILISTEDYRVLSGIPPGHATDLVLTVRNSKEIATIAEKIKKILPDSRPIIRDEIIRTYDAVFNWRSGIMIVILCVALLSFVIFAWDRATGLSAEEKGEIGILKAVGWETSDVLLMKFWEGAAISLTAFLAGVLLAYVHVFFTSSALFLPVLKGWSTLYPDFRLVPFIDVNQVITLFFLTVVPYTITTIVPAWRAATIDPDSVMR